MDNPDVLVLRALAGWRTAGKRALLATVVRTWGSSPRPVGSTMALCEDGAVVGSVSGGCIEDDLIHRFTQAYGAASQAIASGPPTLVMYGVSADEAHRFGLPCGGTLELLLEFDPDAALLRQLVDQLSAGQLVRRTVRLADGAASLQSAAASAECTVSDTELVNTFGPGYRMLLIGAGQLAEYVATMALFNGFAVTVCDPRQEYSGHWNVPGATLTTAMPDDAVAALQADSRTCVIALTHDPKLDDLALLEALRTDAFYIGAMGSRRNNAARRQRLIEHFEQTAESLQRLRGPVGLFIGSKTPPEIAVSIMAEVLAVKNGIVLPPALEVAAAKAGREVPAQPDALPTVLVLASGRGERFAASGGDTHKLQADLCGKTVLERTLDAVRASGLNWHLEDAGHPGMGDSIAAAVRATPDAPGWLVLPADLPRVRAQTLRTLATAALDGDALVPLFDGQRGHPVRFSAACGLALAQLRGDAGAASVLRKRSVATLVVDDPGCVMDIDTVADLQAARAAWPAHEAAGL